MKIGVNFTSPKQLQLIGSYAESRAIDFVEVLIDNFLAVSPESIQQAVQGLPVSFHIMNSRFLEREGAELDTIARKIRAHAKVLKPLYVSDHLATFSHRGRLLPRTAELDYGEHLFAGIEQWQDRLETKVLFENFASVFEGGKRQPQFVAEILDRESGGLLFDASNAVVAEKNCGLDASAWLAIARRTSHFHIGGFRVASEESAITLDSHDMSLADGSLSLLKKVTADRSDLTIVVERDGNLVLEDWLEDLKKVKNLCL